ncbi:protein transporter [Saitoella complicata NRRL Y-17804]|uniref:protein transporter n=1 Tax=Saitoella complicata (strain BCRC 22490 / CBS 7301 / JCM 7358 / NBRC 10748 / NRRL Y-17804) TaxID=698492 RepID=UPI000866E236|nr:protein transporter [Saitoella complicata NRRL Y-17804]ODQ53318.1 protein transporter [Saitoella complicata NRRL Y-17804]
MAHRLLAQVVIVGTQVFGRAFVQAWKQAAANSRAAGAGAAAATGTGNAVKDAITRQTGLTADEAFQILNVEKGNFNLDEIKSRHDKLFDINDPKKGSGSLYLQSKVVRALERLQMEIAQKEAENAAEGKPAEDAQGGSGSGPSQPSA